MAPLYDFDNEQANSTLLEVLGVEGVTGQEKAISEKIVEILKQIGVPPQAIKYDNAYEKIPFPTETGNLLVKLKGTRKGPRRLFMTHMDTVPLCAGAKPVLKGKRIVNENRTALGGDNRTGVACLLTMLATILKAKIPHPPITALFTVREESGLWGARHVDLKELGKIPLCFNVDGRTPNQLAIAAVGADRWSVEISGLASHAGVHPEMGVSATAVAALAITDVVENGWFGKVSKNGKEGTSNVGSVGDANGKSAGQATNVVTDYVLIKGESRSHDASFIGDITRAYRTAFQNAAKKVTNIKGKKATVRFKADRDYYPFRLKPESAVVRYATSAAEMLGFPTTLVHANGGLDANWLVRHGIPTVTFGAGQNNIHTVDEFVDLEEYAKGCRFALTLATMPDLKK